MPPSLLDANVVVALVVEEHVHRGQAEAWFVASGSSTTARTDAYLAHLARSYSSRVATFDQALATLHAGVANMIPSSSTRRKPSSADDDQPDQPSGYAD